MSSDRQRGIWFGAFAALALTGCEQARTPTVEPTQSPDLLEPSDVPATAAVATADKGIPPALRGRWGLTPADCTSTRGDAKGLLEIDADTLRFYESRGALGEVERRSDNAITAEFAFTGEGQSWSRDIALAVEDGGRTLIRTESGEGAALEPLSYTRCG